MRDHPLRVGVIGLGAAGRIHFDHLFAMPEVRVEAVAETNPQRTDRLPPQVQVCEDWNTLLECAKLDAVVVCLPHALHARCVCTALAKGLHVLVEKPLATNLEDARSMVRQAEQTGRTLMVNMTHRFFPPLQTARELLRDGAVGSVIAVRDYYMERIDTTEFPAWFFDPVLAGGGVAITDCVHSLDRVAWLLGEPLEFIGGAGRSLMPETSVEDCAELLCSTRSGIPATVGCFFFNGPRYWEDCLTVFGTCGVMRVHAWSHVEWGAYGAPPQRQEGFPAGLPQAERPKFGHRRAIGEFVASLREGRPPEADGQSVLNAQELIENFYRFTASGPAQRGGRR